MSNGNGRNPDKASCAMRENQATDLRRSGMTYAEIGEVMHCTPSTAYRSVMRALARNQAEEVEELRMVEGARLDRMQQAVWDRALTGDLPAMDRILKIMERRARLFSLDAPQKVAVDTSRMDHEIETLLAELTELAAGAPASLREGESPDSEV